MGNLFVTILEVQNITSCRVSFISCKLIFINMHLVPCLWIHSNYPNYAKNIRKRFSLTTLFKSLDLLGGGIGFENLSLFSLPYVSLTMGLEFSFRERVWWSNLPFWKDKVTHRTAALTRGFSRWHAPLPPSIWFSFLLFHNMVKLLISVSIFFISICSFYKFALSLVVSCYFIKISIPLKFLFLFQSS